MQILATKLPFDEREHVLQKEGGRCARALYHPPSLLNMTDFDSPHFYDVYNSHASKTFNLARLLCLLRNLYTNPADERPA